MFTVRRQYRGCILEHDYCTQSQALAVAISAEHTRAWESITVYDHELDEVIYESGEGKQHA